jgi:hemerythrin-like domain-containing protein
MDVIGVAAALETVEQDHELVLERIQALHEMVAALLAPEIDTTQVFGQLHELNNYFVTQFANHLDEEDRTLFPMLEQLAPDGAGLVERLRQEHTALQSKLDEFSKCLDVACELQDRPPRVVLRDLLTYTWDLWDLLDKHANTETQGIHACLGRHLRDDAGRGG